MRYFRPWSIALLAVSLTASGCSTEPVGADNGAAESAEQVELGETGASDSTTSGSSSKPSGSHSK